MIRKFLTILRRILATHWRIGVAIVWVVLGLWTVLAVYFVAPVPRWLATLLAIGIGGLYLVAMREEFSFLFWRGVPWSRKRLSAAAVAITALYMVYYFGFIRPDPNLTWEADHSRMPRIRIDGNKVYLTDARNFWWNRDGTFTPGWYNRVYALDKISSMYYIVAPLSGANAVAHVFVSFGFSDGQHCTVSVEARRIEGRPYRIIPSMFRQYQLIYVIGDERDVVGVRGGIWQTPVFFWPVNSTPQRMRTVFVDMMERADSLDKDPEFYHLITNNCMNNITWHLRRLGTSLPHDVWFLLTGLSDRVAHRLGYFDTDLPFEKARVAFSVDGWMRDTPLDETFSQRLREQLIRQGADIEEQISR